MSSFSRQLGFGKIGESAIAKWLMRARQYNVLPVYEKEIHEGKGPTLFTLTKQLIAPDLFCFRDAGESTDVRWIEAKTKSAFTFHRISGRWVTGIDLRHYNDYLEVASLSKIPVYLMFLHLDGVAKDTPDGKSSPTGLFCGSLKFLSEHENHRHSNWGKSGMVYWAHETLTRIATLEEINAATGDVMSREQFKQMAVAA